MVFCRLPSGHPCHNRTSLYEVSLFSWHSAFIVTPVSTIYSNIPSCVNALGSFTAKTNSCYCHIKQGTLPSSPSFAMKRVCKAFTPTSIYIEITAFYKSNPLKRLYYKSNPPSYIFNPFFKNLLLIQKSRFQCDF